MREFVGAVARILRDAGHQAWLAGGCVRDKLLGRSTEDYDLATDAPPARVKQLFPDAKAVGAQFGVMLLPAPAGKVEIATFRTDMSYADGRRPEAVRFETDPRQDVVRRDFTINGLLEDPFTGEVLDYVGGRDDLKEGIIRAIGDPAQRFREDHLRMLRAIRFAARLGFVIEPATMAAIQQYAPGIRRIAAERVRDELSRILTEGGASRGMELLDESGLLVQILPEVAAMKGVPQPPQFHPEGDVWVHTLLVLDAIESGDLALYLAALLHDVGKPPTMTTTDRIRFNGHAEIGARMTEEILTRLRYPNELIERVVSHVANHMKFRDVPRMKESTFRRFVRAPQFGELLELHRADLVGSLREPQDYEKVRRRWEALPAEALRPPVLLTGNDLIAMGFPPGPRFKTILEQLEEAQLEGQVRNQAEARKFVLERFQSKA